MKNRVLLLACIALSCATHAQVINNIHLSNPAAKDILEGNYTPSTYSASNVIEHPETILDGLIQDIRPDSLHSYMEHLGTFGNRNSGSDTLSDTIGIGAARNWALAKFDDFSSANENRLVTSFLQFETTMCNILEHKNILAILPGADEQAGVIIIEGHIDSRCEDVCDTACVAQGIDDNASGTALVMELARVMSRYTFQKTIVFMITTGEEQGLLGAEAMARYCKDNGIDVKTVLNNDVVGGVLCGQTASPPACPYNQPIDSLNLRLFSFGVHMSASKQLARFSRLEYNEMAKPKESVPMELHVMGAEDRQGRGGDHKPFREEGYPAIRYCSANENGDANSTDPNYTDNQHSSRDVMGYDTDNDGKIDSFLVDFNYLRRNALVNANTAVMVAQGPVPIDKPVLEAVPGGLVVTLTDPNNYGKYRVACRYNVSLDWDTLVTFDGVLTDTIWGLPDLKERIDSGSANNTWWISAASMDSLDIESLFSNESSKSVTTGLNDIPEEALHWNYYRTDPIHLKRAPPFPLRCTGR